MPDLTSIVERLRAASKRPNDILAEAAAAIEERDAMLEAARAEYEALRQAGRRLIARSTMRVIQARSPRTRTDERRRGPSEP